MANASASAPAVSKRSLSNMLEKTPGSNPDAKRITSAFLPEEQEQLQALVNIFIEESSNLEDYADIYGQAEITKDQIRVTELREKFAKKDSPQDKRNKFYSQILEMIVRDFGNNWLPGYFSKASEYDDYFNGTDLVWELRSETGTVQRIAIDVTSGWTDYHNKVEKAKLALSTSGKFQTVKYFTSEMEELAGEVSLPKIVIGIERHKLIKLARLYLQLVNAHGSLKDKIYRNIVAFDLGQDLVNETTEQLDNWQSVIEKNINIATEQAATFTKEEEKQKIRIRISRLSEMLEQLKAIKETILAGVKKKDPRTGE